MYLPLTIFSHIKSIFPKENLILSTHTIPVRESISIDIALASKLGPALSDITLIKRRNAFGANEKLHKHNYNDKTQITIQSS